jgi:hypothetical protein
MLGAVPWIAHTNWEWACLLRRRRERGDAARATTLAKDAASLVAKHGLVGLGTRIAAAATARERQRSPKTRRSH